MIEQAQPVGASLSTRERFKLGLRERLRAASEAAASAGAFDIYEPIEAYAHDDEAQDADLAPEAASVPTPAVAKPRASLRARLAAASDNSASGEHSYSEEPGEGEDAPAAEFEQSEEITGTLSYLKVFGDWGRGTLWTDEREEIRVTGESLALLQEGLEYCLKGRTVTHAVHGEGFDVTSAMPVISPNDKAIEKYLAHSFTGIGAAKAAKYVKGIREAGGDEAVDALRLKLLSEPWSLDMTALSSKAAFAEGEDPQAALKQMMISRNLMLRLGAGKNGMREKTAKSLAMHLLAGLEIERQKRQARSGRGGDQSAQADPGSPDIVTQSWATLMLNPYEPIGKVSGYAFGMAEMVAGVALIPRDSPLRLSALVAYAVEQGCERRGHTFLYGADLTESLRQIDPTVSAQSALVQAVRSGVVCIDGQRIYSERLLEAEKSVAKRLAELLQPADPLSPRTFADVERRLSRNPEKINPAFAGGFDADQVKAVGGLLLTKQRLHVLSGGPGTGKTAIMETLLALLKSKQFLFCAPTGMAAKVLTSRVSGYGYEASTVHSLLKGGEAEGFNVNEDAQLECDVLVVDECTMNGLVMADAILKALPPNAHLIILGDPGLAAQADKPDSARAGQLPSISPGRFMQDLLVLPNVHHEHLTRTYRNSGGILEVVQETAAGKLATTDRDSVKFSHGLPEAASGFPAVMQEYLEHVARDGIEKTYLVMPLRKGDRETPGWNTTYANHVLRQTCNPHGERLPGTTLHLGDRVVVRENMKIAQPSKGDMGLVRTAPNEPSAAGSSLIDWAALGASVTARLAASPADEDRAPDPGMPDEDEGGKVTQQVVNGDKGTIVAYAMASNNSRLGSPRWIRLALDDGRVIEFPGSDVSSLDHAYAGTVHGAQGSQFKNVIMVVTPGHSDFMNQNMLLTGFSRAQSKLSIHGEDRVIRKIAATPMPPRNSGVVERVKVCLQEIELKKDESVDEACDSVEGDDR